MNYDKRYKLHTLCTKSDTTYNLNQVEFNREDRTLIAINGYVMMELLLSSDQIAPSDKSGMIHADALSNAKPLKGDLDITILANADEVRVPVHKGGSGCLTYPRSNDGKFPPCDRLWKSVDNEASHTSAIKISFSAKQLAILANAMGTDRVTLQFKPVDGGNARVTCAKTKYPHSDGDNSVVGAINLLTTND